jgi:hypothetical protein
VRAKVALLRADQRSARDDDVAEAGRLIASARRLGRRAASDLAVTGLTRLR